MLRIFLITVLVIFILYKIAQFLFRIFIFRLLKTTKAQYEAQRNEQMRRRPAGSNLNIDFVPDSGNKNKNKATGKGDYVDFEEVKD